MKRLITSLVITAVLTAAASNPFPATNGNKQVSDVLTTILRGVTTDVAVVTIAVDSTGMDGRNARQR